MRIQHNIMAMNAYRNYNLNNKALSGNLEKLSSGYKINRAGDDAAGLAISEKMRAQITGLNAAQKNVKDGISLVKTAEGAMQEIQDMLNRMDYLATQSANGTYQDEVDRENLNKEMTALKEEINRIADSANFNGIKLLDGSLDKAVTAKADALAKYQAAQEAADAALAAAPNAKADLTETEHDMKTSLLPDDIGDAEKPLNVAGTKNIYETDSTQGGKPKFSIELDGLAHQVVGAGEKLALTVGGQTVKDAAGNDIVIQKDDGTAYDQGDSLDAKDLAALFNGGKVSIGGVDYTASVDADSSRIVFEADNKSLTAVNPHLDVAFTPKIPVDGVAEGSTNNGTVAKYEFDITNIAAGDTGAIDGETVTFNTDADTTAQDFVAAYNAATHNYTASTDGTGKITLTAKTAGVKTDPTATLTIAADGTDAITATVAQAGKDAGATAGTAAVYTIDLTGKVQGDFTGGGDTGTIDGETITWDTNLATTLSNFVKDYNATANKDYVASVNGDSIVLTARKTGAVTTDPAVATITGATADETTEGTDSTNIRADGTTGSINVGTVDVHYTDDDAVGRLANTVLDLSTAANKALLKDGTKITLGKTTYTLAMGDNSTFKTGGANAPTVDAHNKIVEISSADMNDIDKVISKLTQAASDNDVFSVGQGTTAGKITLQQLESARNTTEMRNRDQLAGYIKITTVAAGDDATAVENAKKEAAKLQAEADALKAKAEELFDGKPLNLQIGDTSDSFNQMKIEVGDMHTKAMGTFKEKVDEDGNVVKDENGNTVMEMDKSIADIDILTSENAQKAVDVIKNAINYVSSVRGDLGAYQNRLDHTANNLSVMAENIQDAESTIRDTDVAEEMMSYVKNNILVQSAQAMLAQANQVPQGVLQLLG